MQHVVRPGDPSAPESVHLATWPQADARLIDPVPSEQVRTARALVEAARAARKRSKGRIRQSAPELAAEWIARDLVAHETLATSVALVDSLDEGFTGTVGDAVPITVGVEV